MKFFLKLIIFLLLIGIIQNIVGRYIPYKTPESVEKINKAKKEHTNIIYFGDSTTTWYSKYDTDQRPIPLMLQGSVQGKYTVMGINHNAYAPFLYDAFTNYMISEKYYPEFIIIPINLKTFSPASDSRPQNQFFDELLYLHFHDTVVSPFLTFLLNIGLTDVNRIFDNIYLLSPIYDGDKIVGTGKEFEDTLKDSTLTDKQTKAMLELYYLERIHPNHRNIQALTTIADRYRTSKTKVIFYVTPIDYESGEKYFGKRFDNQIKENVNTIISELAKHNATVLDLSFAQPAKNFTWHEVNYVNEHLNESGRSSIVKALLPGIDQTLVQKK